MLSAWKKFINKTDQDVSSSSAAADGMPPGVRKLDKELQKKFARGVNYNMKVVIKGDNRVGKTSLFLRLKGYGFEDNYEPTESLNVTSIDWNYKATDDVVKIDLWEAVDAASRRDVNFVDLKMENSTETSNPTMSNGSSNMPTENSAAGATSKTRVTITSTKLQPNGNSNLGPIPESTRQSLAELSESLDVYKGANAVILVMDMTKLWTFKYIQSEIPKIPKQLPILVVANHRDQGHHRTVSSEQVKSFLEGLNRDPIDGMIVYTEASMKNGFGLKLIESFFNVPFLKLQEESLLKQLEINRQDFMTTREELQLMQDSINKEYEQYLELQTIRRRQQADAMSPVNSGLKELDESTRQQIRNTSMSSDIIIDKGANVKSIESDNSRPSGPIVGKQAFVNNRLPSIVIGAKHQLPTTKAIQLNSPPPQTEAPKATPQAEGAPSDKAREGSEDSDEEDELRANPLVADYQSDVDSDDQVNS